MAEQPSDGHSAYERACAMALAADPPAVWPDWTMIEIGVKLRWDDIARFERLQAAADSAITDLVVKGTLKG